MRKDSPFEYELHKLDGLPLPVLDEVIVWFDKWVKDDIMHYLLAKAKTEPAFSATMPLKIREMARTILKDPAEINIAIPKPPGKDRSALCCLRAAKNPFNKGNIGNEII